MRAFDSLVSTLLAFTLLAAEPASLDLRNTRICHTDTHFKMPKFATLADWEAHKALLRKQILLSSGLLPMPERTPLNAQISGRIERDGYSIEKVALESMPGYYLCGNLYRPLKAHGKVPAVLTPHGHWTYGRLENSENFSGPALGINLALQGYAVFAYDAVGYNDTLQTEHTFQSPVYQLWAFSPLGLQLWNSIRALDFVESLPEVDGQRLGVTGASGGGSQAFLLAAVDDRIHFAAPVNMVSFLMQGGCECENAPGLRVETSNVEIAAMMAPRPMLLVSATGDWTRNVPREEYPAIESIYELYRQHSNLGVIQIDAPHNYNRESREAVYRFFGKRVLGDSDAGKFAEKKVEVEPLLSMLVWQGRNLPANAVTQQQLFEYWKAESRKQVSKLDPAGRRELLMATFRAEWPDHVNGQIEGDHIVLSRPGRGDSVPGILLKGSGVPVLVIDPAGAQAARRDPRVEQLVRSQRTVLLIDAFQTGSAVASRDLGVKYYLTFNPSDDANRVQDILTAAAYLGSPAMLGVGKGAAWVRFAQALAPKHLDALGEVGAFSCLDSEFERDLFVPGIQRFADPCPH